MDLVPINGDTSKLELEAEQIEAKIAARERILAHGDDPKVAAIVDRMQGQHAAIEQRMRLLSQTNALRAQLADLRELIEDAHADCDMNPCKQCLERARWQAENRREDSDG